MKKQLKIGVTGPISEVNFGDYAMFVNNFYELNADKIYIFSYNKGFSEKIRDDYCKNMNIDTIEVKLKDNKNNILYNEEENKPKVGFLPFNYPTETPLDILNRIDNLSEMQKAIRDMDILIVNGGGYFNHLWNNSLWRSDMLKKIIAPILLASQMRKKIYFTGNGYGPFDQSEEFFNYTFNYLRNTTYGVRDRMYSKKYLEKIGIESDKIHFIPDDLFFINDRILDIPSSNVDNLLKNKRYILMELYYPLEEIKKYRDILKRFSDNIHKRYGLSIIFVPFDFERGGTWQGEYLAEQLDNFYMYDLSDSGYLPIQDIHNLVKNAELVICNRYHAFVLSIALGTPVINLIKKVCDDHRYYFNKNYGLLEYTFSGLDFNEMDYIKIDLDDALKAIEEDFDVIVRKQKELYFTKEYSSNKEMLKKLRVDYFSKIQLEE
ncbi:polysaccharide pyruvyl transferase family protein [Senegalia massiliensis]|uniref:Polysaccharide pyruvyl transferase family protein n=1 Tax=Senegalia massiliensis TaxID=1720316 RepID=A0A845QZ46_9CLOT|nr:polysaccharide pyruvyl transferase family protein [Senegalia massiliensis]NBI07039.1 polysaccharide pyruvyl transferase family protein [Senegalia massiliensis]